MNSLELDTSLEELARNEYLSVRSINVCDNAGLKSLREILKFQEFNGSFASIRNCGVNSDEELINFCRNYKDVLTLTFNNENDSHCSSKRFRPAFQLSPKKNLAPFQDIIRAGIWTVWRKGIGVTS